MRQRTGRRRTGTRRRGQSSVIGVVMVISITVMGVTGILLFGTSALLQSQAQTEVDAAEHAMTQLDSRFSLVALGSSERQAATVDLGGDATMRVDGDRGWMNVSIVNRTSGAVNETILNTTLGAVVYENDGTSIAYQGGGVWKRGPSGGSVMVSPPEFHYRTRSGGDPTLTLPLVVVRGNQTIASDATVEKDVTIPKYPDPGGSGLANPLTHGEVNITVQSAYYRAWGAFFEERSGGSVTYDHDRNRVSVSLVVERSAPTLAGGVISGSGAYTLNFGQQAIVDSYNSSVAPYGGGGQNASIIAAGDVSMDNNAEIHGDLITGGTLLFPSGNNQRVTGNLTYGGSPPSDPSKIDGTIESGADVDAPDSVGWLINAREAEFRDAADNDNGGDADISGTTLDCSDDCALPAGDYYLDEIDLNGNTLELNGDVEIYVDGDVVVDKTGEEIHVTSGSKARIYLNGDLTVRKGSVTTPDDRATRTWFYMRPGREAFFQDNTFVGVVYGPGNGAQTGVDIKFHGNNNEVFGGIVGTVPGSGSNEIAQGDQVHFDEALTQSDPLAGYADGQPTVTYLHVTVNRVDVAAR